MFQFILLMLSKLEDVSSRKINSYTIPFTLIAILSHMTKEDSWVSAGIVFAILIWSLNGAIRSAGKLASMFVSEKTKAHIKQQKIKYESRALDTETPELVPDLTCPHIAKLVTLQREMDNMITQLMEHTEVSLDTEHQLKEVYMTSVKLAIESFSQLPPQQREEELVELEALFQDVKAKIQQHFNTYEKEKYEKFMYDKRVLQERIQNEL